MYKVIQIKWPKELNATKFREEKKHNSKNVLPEILYQMFKLTTRTLNTGLRSFDGIIDDVLPHQKQNSVNFTHYIRLQVLKSDGAGEYTWSLKYPHKK